VAEQHLTVAVTGPTGEIGRAFIRALELEPEVAEIRGMARRPFDPAAHGWNKTSYVQGDILDRAAVDHVVDGADVVVHLAFIIFGDHAETRRVNLDGSRNVFEATVAAGAERLVYTSSVAAYGFHPDNPQPLTEDIRPRGREGFYYSAQKAELEATLDATLAGSDVDAYVFRPCLVGGPDSPALVTNMPYVQASAAVPGPLRRVLEAIPSSARVLPDFGVPLQIVHADDVATALRAAVVGRGEPGIYNLAAPGVVSMQDIAAELGWTGVRIPKAAIDVTAEVLDRLPVSSTRLEWLHTLRIPAVMDTSKAHERLDWQPGNDARATLRDTVAGARAAGHLPD
jgi:nucleoside-diphosphate-sugar epimerase